MLSQTSAAIRVRERRAAYTPEQRVAYLAEKQVRAARDRADPIKHEKMRTQATACYRRATADPVRKARISAAAREQYWKNQPWRIVQEARIRAEKRGLAHDLTREWAFETWTGVCALTGLAFALRSTTITSYSPSIDRIDNAGGYTQDNCRWILYGVNSLKNNGTDADMLIIAKALIARSAS